MRRYLEIIRQMKGRKTPKPVGSMAKWEVRKNEIYKKRMPAVGQRVRWNRATIGRVVLGARNGWIVVQCEPIELVFVRINKQVQIVRDQP